MAKTINDIVDGLYESVNWGWCDNRAEAREYYGRGCREGIEAILQEIEKSLDLGEPPYLISVEQAYYRTEKLIKELKG